LVHLLLLAQGGLLALGLILLDELDNAYGDVYSGSLSAHSLLPQWSLRQWGVLGAVVCTGLALVLPMHSLEPFLLMLSSVFVPLYGVIIGRLAGLGSEQVPASVKATPGSEASKAFNGGAAALWLGGIALYHLLANLAPQFGAALPTLVATLVLAYLTRRA
jgi:purine-cytosine permease-like protein